jgi:hypothetical protein
MTDHLEDSRRLVLSYSLWPVAVLGAVAVNTTEQHTVRNKITCVHMRRGQGVRLQERLIDIWVSLREIEDMVLQRLQLLMEPS